MNEADQLGLRLVAALGPFWYFRGYLSEGRRWIDTFLAATATSATQEPQRVFLLYGAGKLAMAQGDYQRVGEVAEEALHLAQAVDDALGMSQALELQGSLARQHGDALGGRVLLEQALHWGRRAGDPSQLERVLFGLGHAAREAGDAGRAQLAFEEQLALSHDGPLHGTANALLALAQLAQDRGDEQRAAIRCREALEAFAKLGDPSGMAACFERLAALARRGRGMDRTTRLAGAAAGLREALGSSPTPAEQRAFEDDIAAARAALGEVAFASAWAQGRSLPFDAQVAYAKE